MQHGTEILPLGPSPGAYGAGPTLEKILSHLCDQPEFRGKAHTKAELLAIFARFWPRVPEEAFTRVRTAAKTGAWLGCVQVRAEGARRGTRYSFETHRRPDDPPALSQVSTSTLAPSPTRVGQLEVFQGDNLPILAGFPAGSFDLIYIDPPFNTGRTQTRIRIKTERDEDGDRVGFQGRRYRTRVVGESSYADCFDDYMQFLIPRLRQAYRLLKSTGSLFLHLDYREVHYAKVALDEIFGRDCFINEIIWSYDYGARASRRWSAKHDNILWYAKDPENYCFNYDEIDRIPYMAPSLVGEEKAARGKTPTDSWWHTIVSPNGKEKTGYATQKPLGILTRIVRVHSRPGERLLDFFAGSGSFGEAGVRLGRDVILVDESREAIEVMRRRFTGLAAVFHSEESQGMLAGPQPQAVEEADLFAAEDPGAASSHPVPRTVEQRSLF